MKSLTLFVFGLPKGQPRPKAFRRGGFTGVYDPGTAEGWKAIVRQSIKEKWDGNQFVGPLHLALNFHMLRPKSHFKKDGMRKPIVPAYCQSKPDADNLAKAVMDAITNTGLWRDDSQVIYLSITKLYQTGTATGCEVMVCELEDSPQSTSTPETPHHD